MYPVTVGDLATMRRLIFEAQTSLIAQSRAQADPAADPSAHKLPPAKRTARIREQRDRSGLQCVRRREWHDAGRCHPAPSPFEVYTRMQEITIAKLPKELKLDAIGQGTMVKDVQGDHQCQVSTELDVMEAMTRHSLAFDVVGLIEFDVFQK